MTERKKARENPVRRMRDLGSDKMAFGRMSRHLQRDISSCITFTCFRRLVHSICKVLSTSELGPRLDVKRTRYSASRKFVRKLRLLLANECFSICQTASAPGSRTLVEADILGSIERITHRHATTPSIDRLVQAVADVDQQSRKAASDDFYRSDWSTQVALERFEFDNPVKIANDIQIDQRTAPQKPLQLASYRTGKCVAIPPSSPEQVFESGDDIVEFV